MELAFMKSDLVNDIKTCILCKNVYNMPRSEKNFSSGCVAQLVEQLTLNQWVQGSSPCASTRNKRSRCGRFLWFGPSGREPVKGFGTPVDENKRMRRSSLT